MVFLLFPFRQSITKLLGLLVSEKLPATYAACLDTGADLNPHSCH